jgi:hypothetical protein
MKIHEIERSRVASSRAKKRKEKANMLVKIHNMEAAIAGQAVTLTPIAGVSEALPNHLAASSIVFNTSADPVPADFWKPAAQGIRYIVTIERQS